MVVVTGSRYTGLVVVVTDSRQCGSQYSVRVVVVTLVVVNEEVVAIVVIVIVVTGSRHCGSHY